jgi:hypothetical protein
MKEITKITFHLKKIRIQTFLKVVALIVIGATFFKSIIDIDRSSDTWWYHLPWAARIWNIIPSKSYIFEDVIENRFDGFPLLGEFLQGLFWSISQHVQAANLVSFLSLVLYLYFLKVYFQIPLYLSALALLAIPLVQIHATSCYVDLPGNICVSLLIMMTYLLYTQKDFYTKRNLFVIFLSAACAANIKPQLIPLVFLILCFIVFKIISLRFRQIQERKRQYKWLLNVGLIICLADLLIFATPIKNIVFYGNPFYPLRIEVAGIVLNHKEQPYKQDFPDEASRPQRWVYSILEIKKANNQYYRWSIDQWSSEPSLNRMGGFFGAYVVFNLFLFGYICYRDRCRETSVAFILVTIMSAVASLMPQSHELRYYMYWMISLVSLNLYLVSRLEQSTEKRKFINNNNMGIVCLLAVTLVLSATRAVYVRPKFYTLEKYIQSNVKMEILKKIDEDDEVCIVNNRTHPFLYTSYFHPQFNYSYSVKAAGSVSECGSRKVIN